MLDQTPPPHDPARPGYEPRDLSIPLVVVSALVVTLGVGVVLIALWQVAAYAVPEQKVAGATPPAEMPGEAPINDRLATVPPPRLEALQPLESAIPDRSSRPEPGAGSPEQHPQDLRADRQPALAGYSWVERGKVARIPITRAMDALIEIERAKAAAARPGSGK